MKLLDFLWQINKEVPSGVHHLARTAADRTPSGSELNQLGIDAADRETSAKLQ